MSLTQHLRPLHDEVSRLTRWRETRLACARKWYSHFRKRTRDPPYLALLSNDDLLFFDFAARRMLVGFSRLHTLHVESFRTHHALSFSPEAQDWCRTSMMSLCQRKRGEISRTFYPNRYISCRFYFAQRYNDASML